VTVRLTSLYGPGMTKGAIMDIKNGGPVYVDGASRYAFTHVYFAAGWVTALIREAPERMGIWEVGAKNSLALNDLARHMKKDVQFSGPVEIQEVEDPNNGFPDAREVLTFVSTLS
jgi:nucleoside-diphosphate-sugar epimerase